MSGTTKTYPWATTQAAQAVNLVSTALAPTLEGYEPAMLLRRMQSNAGLLREKMEAALASFADSFGTPFKYDMTPHCWELVRPQGEDWRQWPADPTAVGPTVPDDWDPTRIPELFDMVPIIHEGEGGIDGYQMCAGAPAEYNCLEGQFLAEWLLEYQQHIPTVWRSHLLAFPGTVWLGRNGDLWATFLDCRGERWHHSFLWLGDKIWDNTVCLMRRRNPSI